jgi:hypothetical protein
MRLVEQGTRHRRVARRGGVRTLSGRKERSMRVDDGRRRGGLLNPAGEEGEAGGYVYKRMTAKTAT